MQGSRRFSPVHLLPYSFPFLIQTRAAVALAFEATDVRVRVALSGALRSFVQIEKEAAKNRLRELESMEAKLDTISVENDSDMFVQSAQRPDQIRMQSAALTLLQTPLEQSLQRSPSSGPRSPSNASQVGRTSVFLRIGWWW